MHSYKQTNYNVTMLCSVCGKTSLSSILCSCKFLLKLMKQMNKYLTFNLFCLHFAYLIIMIKTRYRTCIARNGSLSYVPNYAESFHSDFYVRGLQYCKKNNCFPTFSVELQNCKLP